METCAPDFKTVRFLRMNLIYCFDTNLRNTLKANMKTFEDTFFKQGSNSGQQQNQQYNDSGFSAPASGDQKVQRPTRPPSSSRD